MQDLNLKYNSLTDRIWKTYNKELVYEGLTAFFKTIGVAGMFFLLVSVIEFIAHGDQTFRGVLFFSSIAVFAGSAIVFFRNFINNKFKKDVENKVINTAKRIGNHFPDIRDRLTNAIQIFSSLGKSKGTSEDLANYELEKISEKTEAYDFFEIIEDIKYKKTILLFFSLFTLSVITTGIENFALNPAANRVVNYNKSFIPPAPYSFELEDKDIKVLRGEDVKIKVIATGQAPEKIDFLLKEGEQEDFDRYELRNTGDGTYEYNFSSLKNSVTFYAEKQWYSSSVQTDIGKVTVIERPLIKNISGSINFPSYTGLNNQTFDNNNADIVAIKGTRIKYNLLSGKELSEAKMIFVSQSTKTDTVNNESETITKYDTLDMNVSANEANVTYNVSKSGYYYFKIKDTDGVENSDPINYSMIATNDNHPEITLLSPDGNKQLSESAILQIDTEIFDDYGFTGLKLHYKMTKSKYAQPDKKYSTIDINSYDKQETQQIVTYIWDLKELGITPEDEYEFYLEVFDNDIVNGPKSAKTNTVSVRLPSLEEVIRASDDKQEKLEKDITEILKESQDLKKEMDEFKQELRKDYQKREMSWDQKKKAEDIAEKQKKISEDVDKLQQQINETAKQMNEDKVLSPETLQKYMELQKLLEEVDIPQLREHQERMNKALEDMSPEEMRKAMENMEFDDEQFRKNIERTKKILERMKAEQKTDAINKMAEKMKEDMEKLQKETEESDPGDKAKNEELAKKQEAMSEDLEKMNEQLKQLEEMMKNHEDMPMEEMQKAQEDLNYDETQQEMQKSQQNLQQGEKQEAQKSQQKSQQNLKKFAEQMQQMKQQMQNSVTRETLNTMKKATQNLIEMSKQQEQLKNQTQSSSYNSTKLPEINNQQGNLKESLQRTAESLQELSEKSFAVTPEMGKKIGEAMREMQKAINELSERRTAQAGQAQQGSMQSLNGAIGQMQDMLGQMQGAGQGKGQGGPGGMMPGQQGSGMSFGQSLQQAAAQQQMVNNSLRQMMQQGQQGKPGGQGQQGMSMEQQAEYGRLKSEQGKAQKSIQELAEEQKDFEKKEGRRITGDLEKIADEMKEVLTDMESGNINEETLQRQERILSRLLNANRSVNERDYEKKRKGETATQYSQQSPDDLKLQEYLNKIAEERLKESLKQGYTKDFEELIKQYFNELEGEKAD